MRFRKTATRFRRRRRSVETYTLTQCQDCHNVYGSIPCGGPLATATELLTMRTPRNPSTDATEIVSGSDKFIVLDGISFQVEHHHDPGEVQGLQACDPSAQNLIFMLRIWEAIVVLPFSQGTQIPLYLPDFTAMISQGGDLADRVLWKRINHLPMWGPTPQPGIQLETTVRDVGHGPLRVKSKVKLDDRHGLYYVRNYMHDIASGSNIDNCTFSNPSNPCVIPVHTDAWFKLFLHSRK